MCLRIATGALRTSPVKALQVDTHVFPLELRRQGLLLRYYLKMVSDSRHQNYSLMSTVSTDQTYDDVSETYMQRIAGIPLKFRLKRLLSTMQYFPPGNITKPEGNIPPWVLTDIDAVILTENKRAMTDVDVQTVVHELLDTYPGYRIFFTDGSKTDTSVGCAFTLTNAFFSFKLPGEASIYTAELFAILAAMEYIRDNRVQRAVICTDSQSAVIALTSQSREHPILVDILELYHMNWRDGIRCTVVWIPGHSGIAGNVLADYWAKKAHLKERTTPVKMSYREHIPRVKECISKRFAKEWEEYRPTQLKHIKPLTDHWKSCHRKNRTEEVILCRLRLGHTVLTHSYIIDHTLPPICDTCDDDLDVSHLLLHCRRFSTKRQSLRTICRMARVPMCLNTLLGDKDITIIDALFLFLQQCNLIDKL